MPTSIWRRFYFYGFDAPPYSDIYSASGLPPGLSLNTVAGFVSGTPSLAGTFSATITAANLAGTVSAPLTFLIDNVAPPLRVPRFTSAAAARRGALGVPFSYDFRLDNLPTVFTATGLPPGLSLTTPDGTYNGVPVKFGRISGTPTLAGTFTVPISGQNASGSEIGRAHV